MADSQTLKTAAKNIEIKRLYIIFMKFERYCSAHTVNMFIQFMISNLVVRNWKIANMASEAFRMPQNSNAAQKPFTTNFSIATSTDPVPSASQTIGKPVPTSTSFSRPLTCAFAREHNTIGFHESETYNYSNGTVTNLSQIINNIIRPKIKNMSELTVEMLYDQQNFISRNLINSYQTREQIQPGISHTDAKNNGDDKKDTPHPHIQSQHNFKYKIDQVIKGMAASSTESDLTSDW
nr:hypothetical protein Iba_chr11bCG5890 [Ipomoea batatas]